MLLATPKELIGKISYEPGYPAPTCDLTDVEKEIYDKFYKDFMDEREHRFMDDEEE